MIPARNVLLAMLTYHTPINSADLISVNYKMVKVIAMD
jgi:hypothetical protein